MTIGFHYMLKDYPEKNIGIGSCVQYFHMGKMIT